MQMRHTFNTLRPRQNGRNFADGIFKCIFLNENAWIPIKMSMKFVPKGPINNIPALVQIMAWRRPGYKPLPEPMMISLPTHVLVLVQPLWSHLKLHGPHLPPCPLHGDLSNAYIIICFVIHYSIIHYILRYRIFFRNSISVWHFRSCGVASWRCIQSI